MFNDFPRRYGREDNSLALVFMSGSLQIKMLPRLANLEPTKGINSGPPPEQDIPLKVPKKTKLYIEQTQREKVRCAHPGYSHRDNVCFHKFVCAGRAEGCFF